MMLSRRLEALFIFLSALILFTIGISYQEIISFESRFYLFALEMWRHGMSWFPMTYHQPYADYPVTSTSLIYLCSKLMGELNKFTAVFPSAVAAAITLSVVYLIGALHDRRFGLAAVLFLFFTSIFLMEARTISLDQYVTAVTTIGFYLAYSANYLKKTKRLWFIPFLLMLGFAFRGPIGLVVPTGVLCGFYLLDKEFKKFFIVGFVGAFLLVICSAAQLAVAYSVGDMSFVQDVLHMQVVGRMDGVDAPPAYFYFVNSIGDYAITYPLAILVLLGMSGCLLKFNVPQDVKLIQKLLAWVLIILVGLSIPADKKMRYILPMAPALALICAYLFVAPQKYFVYLRRAFYWVCAIFPIICIAIIIVADQKKFPLNFSYPALIGFFILLQLSILFFHWRSRDMHVFFVATCAFVMAYLLIIEPINLYANRTRTFAERVETMRHDQQAALVFYKLRKDGMPIKYLLNMPEEEDPNFIHSLTELLNFKRKAFFITSNDKFLEMPGDVLKLFRVVEHGKIGHKDVVVFSQR